MPRAIALVLLLVLVACSGKQTTVSREVSRTDGVDGESYRSSTSIGFEDPVRAKFDRAAALERERDFTGAIGLYRELYRQSAKDEVRARALLQWARAEASLLNPDRDLPAAIARLDLLLEEFPDSALRFEAQEERTRLQLRRAEGE